MKKEPKKMLKYQIFQKKKYIKLKSCKRKSIDESKEIARLRRIKNRGTKEGLINNLLNSESSNADCNYMKNFNNNNNNNNDTHNNTYDGKIRDKISVIRMILSRLGTIAANNDREKIKKELYEIEEKGKPFR